VLKFVYKIFPLTVFASYPILLVYTFLWQKDLFLKSLTVPAGVFLGITLLRIIIKEERPYVRYGVAPVFAKNFEMDLDANKVTYTLTEAKSGEITFGAANTTGYIYVGKKPDTFVVKNSTDKVIRVGMWVAAESPVTMSW